MTQQTEQICFCYDGSEEAKQALKWVNEIEILNGRSKWRDQIDTYFSSDGNWWSYTMPDGYRLVTTAEFLRLVNGENEWTPKYGEEVEVSDNLINWHKHIYIGKNPIQNVLPYIIVTDDGGLIQYKHIRPIRKSVREEVANIIDKALIDSSRIYSGINITDEILSKFNVTPKD